jgi:hypothetical protein
MGFKISETKPRRARRAEQVSPPWTHAVAEAFSLTNDIQPRSSKQRGLPIENTGRTFAASAGEDRFANKLEVLQDFGEPSAGLGSAAVSFVGLAVAARKSLIGVIVHRLPDPSCRSEVSAYNDSPITIAEDTYITHNTMLCTRNHAAGIAARAFEVTCASRISERSGLARGTS